VLAPQAKACPQNYFPGAGADDIHMCGRKRDSRCVCVISVPVYFGTGAEYECGV